MVESRLFSPGRICLLGDHCDWAGGYCLATSIRLGMTAVLRRREDRRLVVESTSGGSTLRGSYPLDDPSFSPDDPLRYAAAALLAMQDRGYAVEGLELKVEADLPARRGLGSSAAFTLLVLRALAQVVGREIPAAELAELAYVAEREILGIPCGLMDQAASISPGPVFLDFTEGRMKVEELEPPRQLFLALGDCRRSKDTERILRELNAARFTAPRGRPRYDRESPERDADGAEGKPAERAAPAEAHVPAGRPSRTTTEKVAYAFDALFPELVGRGREALLMGDLKALGEAMTVCQAVYDEYLVPACEELKAPTLHHLLDVCRVNSALGQKWTGSGGNGAFAALARDAEHQEVLVRAIASAGGSALALTI